MQSADNIAEIGILIYPAALLSAVYGLTDLFMVANQLASRHEGLKRPLMRISHWQENESGQIIRVHDTREGLPNKPMFVIAPPSFTEPISAERAKPFAVWLRDLHTKGATLCSVCAGSFVLGATGLLEGRASTTHWSYAESMAKRHPESRIEGDKLIIDDGDIITAGGFMAWTDLGLRIVHRLLGPTLMMELARFMLVDPPGREQRYYSSFAPRLHHGDETILKVQHWLQKTGARDVSLALMAKQAGMEERTFLRRFTKATGLKPIEYCQHLRVGKAREMLEFTHQNIEQIAYAVGYEDTGAFRKVFHKVVGLTPGDYRSRFSLAQSAA